MVVKATLVVFWVFFLKKEAVCSSRNVDVCLHVRTELQPKKPSLKSHLLKRLLKTKSLYRL
jgi:hypothetical protein